MKIKVLYEKMPPKSRTGKNPSGIVFSYTWENICRTIQEIRDRQSSMSVSIFKPGEAKVTQVIVGDEGVTFYLEPKVGKRLPKGETS